MLESSSFKSVFKLVSLIIFISLAAQASENISFGEVSLGDSRIDLKESDFKLLINLPSHIELEASLEKKSIQWVRTSNVLMTPRARINIEIRDDSSNYYFKYRGKVILLQSQEGTASSNFFISLFHKDYIEVFQNGIYIGQITHIARPIDSKRKKHLVDYSCSSYNIKTTGLTDQFVSIGCRSHRVGKIGKERRMVEILWTTPNYRVQGNSEPPYLSVFMTSQPLTVKLISDNNKSQIFTISADIPKRLHRLNIAYGLGPYVFDTTFKQEEKNNKFVRLDKPMAPAAMLYFNYTLDKESSIRGFNAIVSKDSLFNNFGSYYANDIASLLDTKLTLTTLLGIQHLYFKFDGSSPIISEPIFPQGLEITYKHAFGIKNYIISGGAFLSPSESYKYQNIWLRWGRNIFWELNYIFWGNDDFSARMWGLSAGFHFGGYL